MAMNPSNPGKPSSSSGAPAQPRSSRAASEREALLGDYVAVSPRTAIRRRAVILGVAAFIFAGMLLAVVLNIDAPKEQAQQQPSPQAEEVIAPSGLTLDEQSRAETNIEREIEIAAPRGGWIQLMKDGRLAQQYRCDRLDPNPPGKPAGWLNMRNPKVELYLNDGRAISLEGNTALVQAPNRELESGTITGDVLIQMFELGEARTIDYTRDQPALVATTDEASYDNFQGEIRCDGDIDIQTPTAHLPGKGLRVLLNEVEGRLEWLQLAEANEIRLAMDSSSQPTAPREHQPRERSPSPPASLATSPRQESSSTQPAVAKAPAFYRLNLKDNVRVRQRDWQMSGDDLNAVFSLESRGLGDVLAEAPQSRGIAIPRLSPAQEVIALTIAVQPAIAPPLPRGVGEGRGEGATLALYKSTPDEVIIQCDGPLTMSPLASDDPGHKPTSPDDARFELAGSPVRIVNNTEGANASCASLVYGTLSQRLELLASAQHPLDITAPELRIADARQLWINRTDHKGAIEGPVRMFVGDRPAPAAPDAAPLTTPADAPVEIACAKRVDLTFLAAAESDGQTISLGKLQNAIFHEAVNVLSEDFKLYSDQFQVELNEAPAANDKARRVLKTAIAKGNVHALSVADDGELSCDDLTIDFTQDPFGRTVPQLMTAIGNVAANDPATQIVWSDQLKVQFTALPPLAAGADAPQRSRVEPTTLDATGDVQVLTNDGARILASALNADLAQEIATFTNDVMLISDRGILHQGTHLELRKRESTANWPGPGEFISLASPIDVSAPNRIQRPVLDDPSLVTEMRATWRDSLLYTAAAGQADIDVLTMTGDVKALSTPTPLESNSLDSQTLQLEFARIADGSSAATELSSSNRELTRMIAQGNARLESRNWLAPDHADVPRVYFIAGDHVTYDAITSEAAVNGKGQLLVRDVTPAPQPQTQPQQDSAPFSAKGTTDFNWSDELRMTRREDGLFDIAMVGNIEVRHLALDDTVSTMVARRLDAVVARTSTTTENDPPSRGRAQRRPGSRPGSGSEPSASPTTIDLGGAMELKRLRGAGAIYINTPTRDIDCETFDYDYVRGIAILDALPGRTVSVITSGNPNPFTAERVEWNMTEDSFVAIRPAGARPR